jgi:hypothetical protein
MNFPQFSREGSRHLSIRHQHMQFALERINDFGVLSRLHLGDQPVQPGAQGRIGHFILIAQSFQRPRAEDKSLQEPQVFLVQHFQPGWLRLFHKLKIHFNILKVKKIEVHFNKL